MKLKIAFVVGCLMGAAVAWLLREMARQRVGKASESVS